MNQAARLQGADDASPQDGELLVGAEREARGRVDQIGVSEHGLFDLGAVDR